MPMRFSITVSPLGYHKTSFTQSKNVRTIVVLTALVFTEFQRYVNDKISKLENPLSTLSYKFRYLEKLYSEMTPWNVN